MSLRDRSQGERRGGEEERGLRQRHGAIEAAERLGRGLVHKVSRLLGSVRFVSVVQTFVFTRSLVTSMR